MAKQRISLECLSYHASAPADEARRLKVRNSSDDIDYIQCILPSMKWSYFEINLESGLEMIARNVHQYTHTPPKQSDITYYSKWCYYLWIAVQLSLSNEVQWEINKVASLLSVFIFYCNVDLSSLRVNTDFSHVA